MITEDDLRIHGIGIQWAEDAVQLSYLYPGAPTSSPDEPRNPSQRVVLGLSTADPDSQDVLDEQLWRFAPVTNPTTRIWLRHAYTAHVRQEAMIYEHDGEVVLIWPKIPPLAVELELLDEGFTPALATWRAPATMQTRAVARRLSIAAPHTLAPTHIADILDPAEHADRAEHVWLRWFARFDDRVVKIGDRTYDLRAARHRRDSRLTVVYRRRGSELRFEFDISRHPLVHDVKVGIREGTGEWATTQLSNIAWSNFTSLITAAAQLLARSSEPPAPADDRLAVWESTFANALAEFELPASKPLYTLAHRTAVAGLAATDVLLNKHGAKLTEALRVGGRKHNAMIRSLEQSLHHAFTEAPSEAARWELISATRMLLEKTGHVSPPGPATEEFWRTWKAPDVLILARRRYQLRPHEVHFGRNTLNLRYGAGPGGDTPSLAVLRLQISLPDRHGRPTLIVTHLDGKRAMLQQTPPWTLTVPELEALTGDQIALRLSPIHGSTPLDEITWEEALVAEFEAQDPRDPQLRLERRLGSGLSIFAAYLPGPTPTPILARATINDTFEIEELTPEAQRPLDELAALRARLEAALAVVARDFADDDNASPPDYNAAHRAAVSDPPPKQLIDRLAAHLGSQHEEATLAALRTQARTDLGAASRMVAFLAAPKGPSPSEVVAWLGEHDLDKSAALVSAYIFTPTIALAEFAADLATSLDAELGARRMRSTAKPPQAPRSALRHDAQERAYILEATGTGVRQHFVQELPDHSDSRFVALGPPRILAAMQPTPRVYADERVKDATIEQAWQHFDALLHSLGELPTHLADARQLLAAAAVLADSPKCQGLAKENALRALAHARDAHNAAREQLTRGRDARAVDRLQQALRQIAEVAHQSAASCGAGQGALLRDEFKVPTLPEMAANMNGEV